MFYFNSKSSRNLGTCHTLLQKLFNVIGLLYNCTILKGHRNKEEQNKAYAEERTQLKYPLGKHNKYPSNAVDAGPYPIVWPETYEQIIKNLSKFNTMQDKIMYLRGAVKVFGRWFHFNGYVKGTADQMKIPIRQGSDWDGDYDFDDQTFDDFPHTELL